MKRYPRHTPAREVHAPNPTALVEDLRAGLSRCHALVDAARNAATARHATPRPGTIAAIVPPRAVASGSAGAPPPPPYATPTPAATPVAKRAPSDAPPADPLTGLTLELGQLRARLERSARALSATPLGLASVVGPPDAADPSSDDEPPLLAPAPHGAPAEAPRGVDPVVWRVLRDAVARAANVTVEMHRGAAARGEPATLITGCPVRFSSAPDGRIRVVFAVAPDVEQVVPAARIARATLVLGGGS